MLTRKLDGFVGYTVRALQDLYPERHVSFHDLELAFGQLPWLVQDRIGNTHLTDVMQQRTQAEDIERIFAHPQVTPEHQRQYRDAQAVQRCIVVFILEMGEAN